MIDEPVMYLHILDQSNSFQVGVSGAHSASVTSLKILVVLGRRQGTGSVMEHLVGEPSRLKKEFATTEIARDVIILLILFLRIYVLHIFN